MTGQSDRARELNREIFARFPDYLFAFVAHGNALLDDRSVDEARSLLETGPRGCLLFVQQFDPTRRVFHISEAVAYIYLVVRYLLDTDREKAAESHAQILHQIAPDDAVLDAIEDLFIQRRIETLIERAQERVKAAPPRPRTPKKAAAKTTKTRAVDHGPSLLP